MLSENSALRRGVSPKAFLVYEMKDVLADIHCHIVPYVDDGAAVLEEAIALLESQYLQGVRIVCATPHLRAGMFESSDEEIIRQFKRLKEMASEKFPDLSLFLSREYHCDKLLRDKLISNDLLPLGDGLLIEFSSRHTEKQIHEYIRLVKDRGLVPVIAHVERYPVIDSKAAVKALKELGARIQVNAGSVLGREGFRKRLFVRSLLKEKLVDVVASDCHDTENRPCELQAAYEWIRKKCGASYASDVLYRKPLEILGITKPK